MEGGGGGLKGPCRRTRQGEPQLCTAPSSGLDTKTLVDETECHRGSGKTLFSISLEGFNSQKNKNNDPRPERPSLHSTKGEGFLQKSSGTLISLYHSLLPLD